MDLLDLRDYCLAFPLTEETTPFDETTLVYKVHGKMFAMTDMEDATWVVLKSNPDRAIELRESYDEIDQAFHMNKKHWISVQLDGDLPVSMIKDLIGSSYLLVVEGFPKSRRAEISKAFIEYEENQRK